MSNKVWFSDFWPGFVPREHRFWQLITEKYDVILDSDPDFLFYGPFGNDHTSYNCIKIFMTGENIRPNFNMCHYSISFDYLDDPRNHRYPIYAWVDMDMVKNRNLHFDLLNRKFCCFLYSNPHCQIRNDFFKELSRYKFVESGGLHLNNIGYKVGDKLSYIKQFKFVIAYENSSYPGYTTEKLTDAFIAGCLPIYWGNPLVHKEFNPKSFINSFEYPTTIDLINWIIHLDKNDDKYLEYFKHSAFYDNKIPDDAKDDRFLNFIGNIFANGPLLY